MDRPELCLQSRSSKRTAQTRTTIMRVTSLSIFISLAVGIVSAHPGLNVLKPRRTTSILNKPATQPDLPTANQAAKAAAVASLNLDEIQGDILVGMKKKKELFLFFSINDVKTFKAKLASDIHSLITTTNQLLDVAKQPITALNIAFSQTGLTTLGVTDDLGDLDFRNGQFVSASALGDPDPATNWVPALADASLHGVFLLASDTLDNINAELANIKTILGDSIVEKHSLQGEARPGGEEGHEHFGFADGISQPAVNGFTSSPTPGQTVVDAGHFLLGEGVDSTANRPAWAKDGSFLVFRQLEQLVPEFKKFLADNPISHPQLTAEQGSELLGARMIGRWKSGAPIDLAPLFDDPDLAKDPNRNNDFTFAHDGEDIQTNQTRCPFSAHIRKTRPRADFNPQNTANHIIRAGIPYGPEVSPDEAASNKTTNERGLAFVAYQSDLSKGFKFMQTIWANNPSFKPHTADATPGVDPVIGALQGSPRNISGLDPLDPGRDITLFTDFVLSRGGGYFFSPPVSAIAGKLAA